MCHKDGVKGEDFFEDFCKENKIKNRRCHRPFDFIINERTYVEVKSAKLLTRFDKNKNVYRQGRYECWNNSQLKKIKDSRCYVCLIVSYKGKRIIQGFVRAKDYPERRKIGINQAESLNKISRRDFIRRFRK